MSDKPCPGGSSHKAWSQIWALYEGAAALPSAEWDGYLQQHAPAAAVRTAVLQMLREPQSSLREGFPPDTGLEADRTGSRLGHYVVSARLGRGGMGEVYSAFDEELQRPVALKFVRPSEFASLANAPDVMREAKAASALNHPHIVTVHEVIPTAESLAIVMEFVPGHSLRTLCGSPLPAVQVASYGKQIAHALSAAHAAGIIHRDVKPENLMVRPDGYVKLLDFGLARQIAGTAQNEASSLGGTWRYMSPEQVQATSLTSASDVFSFGVVLYELLGGKHPFAAPSLVQTLHCVTSARPAPLDRLNPEAPTWLSKLILRMLEKDPAARPSASEVLTGLETGGPPWRHPWLFVAAALLLSGAALIAFLRTRPASQPAASFFQSTFLSADNYATALAISPSGNQIAFSIFDGGLYLRSIEDRRQRLLVTLPNERIERISWVSQDGPLLVSSQELESQRLRISRVGLESSKRSPLPVAGSAAIFSPDGSRIAYLAPAGNEVWVAAAGGTDARRLLSVADPSELKSFLWSPSGRLLHYFTTPEGRLELFAWTKSTMHTVEVASGRLLTRQDLAPMGWPILRPDGHLLYLDTTSTKYLEVQTDPATGRLQGEPHLLANAPNQQPSSEPAVSADGRVIAAVFNNRASTYLSHAGFDPNTARLRHITRFSAEGIPDLPHAWVPDGSAVLFESHRHGSWDIFRHRIGQPTPDLLVDLPKDQFGAQVSPDGRWILFQSGPVTVTGQRAEDRTWNLMRVPLEGGIPELVPNVEPIQEFACHYKAKRCVIREHRNQQAAFYDLDPATGKGRELARAKVGPAVLGDWTLSPDGTMVAMVDLLRDPATIHVIYLDQAPLEKEIPLQGPPPSRAVVPVWTADGKGWYFPVAGDRMRQFNWDGSSRYVHEVHNWLVPTHDGKRVAFLDLARDCNVWICRR